MIPEWWPEWSGETVVIVASGPSAKEVPLNLAKDETRFIAINASWKLAPWADFLHGCDAAWWKYTNGCPEFSGIKLTVDRKASEAFEGVHLVNCRKPDDRLFLEPLNTVGWGGHSGFQALNLAVQFKPAKIILVGYDLRIDRGLHWHGRHPEGMNNPRKSNLDRWRRAVDNAWRVIEPTGIKVINCSADSALKSYPKMTFEKALCA